MSWETISRPRGGATKSGIWCSLSEKDVRVGFGADVLASFGGLKAGDRLEVALGKDDHIGRVRFRRHTDGTRVRVSGKSSGTLVISFRKWPGVMDEKCRAVQMPFKVVGDGLVEATLPYWGQAQKLRATKLA